MAWIDCIYEYDGSYAGLLCCVFDSYVRREAPISVVPAGTKQISLYPTHTVTTVHSHARRIETGVRARSAQAVRLIRRGYLTCLPEKDRLLCRVMLRLFREGPAFLKDPTDLDLYPLHRAIRHLGGELEKLRGFIRFSAFQGIYAAEIEPKNRVLPALRSHFCSRFADQPFVIYDRTHREALLYDCRHWQIVPLDAFEMARPDQTEAQYRRLWKTFYDTIAIRERTNPRCQRTQMPLRYRGTMTEFQDASWFSATSDAAEEAAPCSLPGTHQ